MKQKYGVFAEESGETKLIHTGSVRFSRTNRFALRVFGQGVFFAHYQTVQDPPILNEKGETVPQSHIEPVGERHKPKHIEKPDWKAVPSRVTDIERDVKYMDAKPAKKFRPRRKKVNLEEIDPHTGESLGDVLVDMHRERLARNGHV